MHFEHQAAEYAGVRPPYPRALFQSLRDAGVIGPGRRVLEIGAGAGLATRDLMDHGCEVVAIEPGARLAALLRASLPGVEIITARLEEAPLRRHDFDAVVAATAMHWVDLSVGLPRIHAALRPAGLLAVWRTIFGDDEVRTNFRDRVHHIVAQRHGVDEADRESRPTMAELATGGWFETVRSERWRWSIELTTDQVRRLFATFSDWTPAEAEAAARAAEDLGGTVTEHYQSVLHLLRRRSTDTEQ